MSPRLSVLIPHCPIKDEIGSDVVCLAPSPNSKTRSRVTGIFDRSGFSMSPRLSVLIPHCPIKDEIGSDVVCLAPSPNSKTRSRVTGQPRGHAERRLRPDLGSTKIRYPRDLDP